MKLSLDFETCSEVNLKKVGAAAYAEHPSTQVMCMAYQFEGEMTRVWAQGQPFPERVFNHVWLGKEVHAFNAMFEWYIWNGPLTRAFPDLPELLLDECFCTMARALYWGLPGKLEVAGKALNSVIQKDQVGYDLMMRMNKPRSYLPDGTPTWWHLQDPAKFQRLQDYCMRDVDTEVEIASMIPVLPDPERDIWLMDARMNSRGFRLDLTAVRRLAITANTEANDLNTRMYQATGGAVASTTQMADLGNYVRGRGVQVSSLAGPIIDQLLTDQNLLPDVRAAISIRKLASKTSTRKLIAMIETACQDGRVRGLVQHYGASRTGRWAGRLVQIQNLPRPMKGIDAARVIEQVLAGADGDHIRLFWGEPLDVISSCLRGCFIADPGHQLVVFDFSAIEARVIAWLAGQQDILDVFAAGEDVYVYTANGIGSTNRQLGKVLVLACGFGMGGPKFQATALTYGIHLTDVEAAKLVATWRAANFEIQCFWSDLGNAVVDVLDNPGKTNVVGRVSVRMGKGQMQGSLLITLPSGRYLVYRNARMEWNDGRREITYWGVNQTTRNWEKQRTYGGKLAENVTQAVARCLLADAKLRCEATGIPPVATIHDEIVAEVPAQDAPMAYQMMQRIMNNGPLWADGLPLGGAGWIGPRYGKG